jgi:signal transduction histidine kinase
MAYSGDHNGLGQYQGISADELLAAIPVFVVLIDSDGVVISLNRIRPDIPIEKIIGKVVYAEVAPEHQLLYAEQIKKVVDTAESTEFVCQNGLRNRWYSVSLSPLGEDQILCVATDITLQRANQESVRSDSVRIKQVLSRVPAIIWTTDLDLNLLSLEGSQIGSRLDPVEDIGKSLTVVVPSAAGGDKLLIVSNQALKGKSGSYDHVWDQDYFEISVEPLRNDGGEIVGTLGVGINVTRKWKQQQELEAAKRLLQNECADASQQLMEASDRLKERDRWLRNLIAGFPTGAAITRVRDGLILAINDIAAAAHHRTADTMLNTFATMNYVDVSQRQRMIERANSQATPQREVVEIYRGDGKTGWVAIYVHTLEFAGEPCFFTLIRDITKEEQDRKKEKLERRRLEQTVASQERDRKLLALEIHDGMAQDLAGAKMFLDVFLHSQPNVDPQGNLERAFRLLGKSIDEARRLINGLRPPVLEQEGLLIAIENLVTEFQADHDIQVEYEYEDCFVPFSSEMELAIYRIVQESLNNIWRHSESSHARLTVRKNDVEFIIQIEDDGVGFDVTLPRENNYGLNGIEERACLLGGEATIASKQGQGTQIEVRFPTPA